MSTKTLLKTLVKILEKKKVINYFGRDVVFYDEPRLPLYSLSFNKSSRFFKENKNYIFDHIDNLNASGVSFESYEVAKLKCLMEGVERLCLHALPKNNALFHNLKQLSKKKGSYLDINKFSSVNQNTKFRWIKGKNLINNSACLIPAQMVYANYLLHNKEPLLNPNSYNGAASGIDRKSALVHGLYELIERDSFMTAYLKKSKIKRIDTDQLNDEKIKKLANYYSRYKLKPFLFDITNDLAIPSFVCMLVDETGIGPALTVGAKADIDPIKAILGSLEEAFLTRPSIRVLLTNMHKQKNNTGFSASLFKRAYFWSKKINLEKLGFWFNLKPGPLLKANHNSIYKDELKYLKKIISNKGFEMYYVDIKINVFNTLPVNVCRLIIPQLQPLYLDEEQKLIRNNRIDKITNQVPHPFL